MVVILTSFRDGHKVIPDMCSLVQRWRSHRGGRLVLALLVGALMVMSVASLPGSFYAHQYECEHSSCPVAHGCCPTHAPALAPSISMLLAQPVLTASVVSGPLASPGITASSVLFQPPRA